MSGFAARLLNYIGKFSVNRGDYGEAKMAREEWQKGFGTEWHGLKEVCRFFLNTRSPISAHFGAELRRNL